MIKTHTARLDFVDIIKPTFLRNAVATNRQRRVIASYFNILRLFPILSLWNLHYYKIEVHDRRMTHKLIMKTMICPSRVFSSRSRSYNLDVKSQNAWN